MRLSDYDSYKKETMGGSFSVPAFLFTSDAHPECVSTPLPQQGNQAQQLLGLFLSYSMLNLGYLSTSIFIVKKELNSFIALNGW